MAPATLRPGFPAVARVAEEEVGLALKPDPDPVQRSSASESPLCPERSADRGASAGEEGPGPTSGGPWREGPSNRCLLPGGRRTRLRPGCTRGRAGERGCEEVERTWRLERR